jgi:hypothetical protein
MLAPRIPTSLVGKQRLEVPPKTIDEWEAYLEAGIRGLPPLGAVQPIERQIFNPKDSDDPMEVTGGAVSDEDMVDWEY